MRRDIEDRVIELMCEDLSYREIIDTVSAKFYRKEFEGDHVGYMKWHIAGIIIGDDSATCNDCDNCKTPEPCAAKYWWTSDRVYRGLL